MGMREETLGRGVTTYNFPEVATENSTTFKFAGLGYAWTEGPYFSMCWLISP